MHISIYLSIYLSIDLYIYLSIYIYIYIYIGEQICANMYMYTFFDFLIDLKYVFNWPWNL